MSTVPSNFKYSDTNEVPSIGEEAVVKLTGSDTYITNGRVVSGGYEYISFARFDEIEEIKTKGE